MTWFLSYYWILRAVFAIASYFTTFQGFKMLGVTEPNTPEREQSGHLILLGIGLSLAAAARFKKIVELNRFSWIDLYLLTKGLVWSAISGYMLVF